MTPYDGQDPITPPAHIAGKGYWVTANEADDSDDRDAATAMILAEGAHDRLQFIGWRYVNGLQGGSYAGDITWSGTHIFNGQAAFNDYVQFAAAAGIIVKKIQFDGASSPASTADPGSNFLYASSILKVTGMITTDGGGTGSGHVTVQDGINIASVTVTTTYVEITFAHAFANTNYAPVVSDCDSPGSIPNTDWNTRTTTKLRVGFQAYGGGAVNPSTTVVRFAIHITGQH